MWKNVRLLFSKELTGAIRDRRTLFLTVFFPLIFYPLVLAVIGQFNEAERVRYESLIPTILVVDRSEDQTFGAELAQNGTLRWRSVDTIEEGLTGLKRTKGMS